MVVQFVQMFIHVVQVVQAVRVVQVIERGMITVLIHGPRHCPQIVVILIYNHYICPLRMVFIGQTVPF